MAYHNGRARWTATVVLLRAALALEGPGKDPWTLEDLTVRAWQLDPGRFGLKGYGRHYPDHNRVKAEVHSKKTRFARAVERHHGGTLAALYRLTPEGRLAAAGLPPP